MPGTYKGIMALREAPLNVYQVNMRFFFNALVGFYFTSSISEGRNQLEIDKKKSFPDHLLDFSYGITSQCCKISVYLCLSDAIQLPGLTFRHGGKEPNSRYSIL